MKWRKPIIAAGLLTVLCAAIAGLLHTDRLEQAAFHSGPSRRTGRIVVDEEPVLTARALMHFAAEADEQLNAEEALQIADDEVETAFATPAD